MALGIAGEAGEVTDIIKKTIIYNRELPRDKLIEEIGDLKFYIEGLKQYYQISNNEVIRANLTKLLTGKNARYPSGRYSNQQANKRADKQ